MTHHMRIVPGTNVDLRQTTPSDPSGFRDAGLTPAGIEGLMEFIQEECDQLIARVPQGVMYVAHVPETLQTFSMHRDCITAAPGSISHALPSVRIARREGGRAFGSVPCNAEVYGMGIRCDASTMADATKRDALRHVVRHEILHVVTNRGINPWMRSRNEALAEPLMQGLYGVGSSVEGTLANPDKYGWDASKLQFSGGFAEPDLARATFRVPGPVDALYLSAPLALRGIAVEQVWKIWQVLLTDVEVSGNYPCSAEIRSAILDVLQEDGERVLQNPCFQPVQMGTHVFALSAQDDSCAITVPMQVTPDPTFGLDAQGVFHEHHCTFGGLHNRLPYQLFFHDRANNRIPGIHVDGTLGRKEPMSYQTILDRFTGNPDFQRSLAHVRLGNRMTLEVPGLEPVMLRKSPNDPQVRRAEEWFPEGVSDGRQTQ